MSLNTTTQSFDSNTENPVSVATAVKMSTSGVPSVNNSSAEELSLHIRLLFREFKMRQLQNQHYSLRRFAKDLKLSPASVSLVLRGKKGLSDKSGLLIASIIKMTEQERHVFRLSVNASHARKASDRMAAKTELEVYLASHHLVLANAPLNEPLNQDDAARSETTPN